MIRPRAARRHACRWAGLAALLLLLAACQGPGFAHEPPESAAWADVYLDVPVVVQEGRWECGSASLQSLCAYYKVAIDEQLVAELVERAEVQDGLMGSDIQWATERVGLESWLYEGQLDRSTGGLLAQLEAGRPLLVLTREDDSPHYALLIGFDEESEWLYLLDPRRGFVTMSWKDFEGAWQQAGRFTLLAVPPPGHPGLTSPSVETS